MLLLALLGGFSCFVHASYNAFEEIAAIPRGWTHIRDATPHEVAKFTVSIRQSNLAQLEQIVLEVSNPDHPSYGRHLTGQELSRMVKPASHSLEVVHDWLEASSVFNSYYDDSHSITFFTSVRNASVMFDTSFAWYHNAERSEDVMRTTRYSVPSSIASHINYVTPLVKFPGIRLMGSAIHSSGRLGDVSSLRSSTSGGVDTDGTGVASVDCTSEITPTCLLKLYNVYYIGNATNGNKAAFASFLQEYARTADLKKFYNKYAPWAKGSTFSVTKINGGKNAQNSQQDSLEANLDVDYLGSISYPAPLTEFSTGGCGSLVPDANEAAGSCDNEPYLEFLTAVLALPDADLPQVISISYGEDEQTWPTAQATHICALFMQLTSRGTTILVASGDSGPGATCTTNTNPPRTAFLPAFPASCPYVTTVGATTSSSPEQSTSFTGGGFSNYFSRPSWQNGAVTGYIAALGKGGEWAAYYNASGRAYPDVSAQGANFDVFDKGVLDSVYGTSASTPVFAALVSLLNSALLTAGKPALGFLNPLLYGAMAANGSLTDITTGASSGCEGQLDGAGFAAVAGWDAATGLGTPDFGKMLGVVVPGACNTLGVLGRNPSSTVCSGAVATSATNLSG